MNKHIANIIRYIRYFNYYRRFKRRGKNLSLARNGVIIRPEEISFGENVFISNGFKISANNLTFGNNILIGPNLTIECTDHKYHKLGQTIYANRHNKIKGFVTIEDDVWIGANVTILKNVVIGEGSVVGACSLVSKDIRPYTINVGIPTRVLKFRFNHNELKRHIESVGSNYSYKELKQIFEIKDT